MWVYSIFNWKDWISSKPLLASFFARHNILRQSSTLIVHLHFLQVFLYVLFAAQKAPKTPGRDKISRLFLQLASCFATSLGRPSHCLWRALAALVAKPKQACFLLAGINLATSILSAVCRVLRIALRTAIFKKYNCRTTFGRTSHNGRQTAGISVVILTLPVFL